MKIWSLTKFIYIHIFALIRTKNIYFTKPNSGSKGNPSGRLYCRYYNIKRRYRKIGFDTQEKEAQSISGSMLANPFPDEEDIEFLNSMFLLV